MNKKYVILSILIGCIVGSVFVCFFRRTEDNKASDVHYKTVLHNTAKPAEKTAPVQEDDAEQPQGHTSRKAKILSAKKSWKKYRKTCCINKLVMNCLSGITRRFNSRLMNLKRGDKR